MTSPQDKKSNWAVIWLLSVTVGPMIAITFDNNFLWIGLLLVCMIINLTASFLITSGDQVRDASANTKEITKSCLFFFGGLLIFIAFFFFGCLATLGKAL